MHTTTLTQFLGTLPSAPAPDRRLRCDAMGRVQDRLSHCALTSLFEPVRQLTADGASTPAGHEALMCTWIRDGDLGLSPWEVFSLALGGSALVELDHLRRLVYTPDYFSRTDARRLVVDVHGRLLAAAAANHGRVFHRAVTVLGLHPEQFAIQIPSIVNDDLGLLLFAVDNYRRNGSAVVVQASDPAEAGTLFAYARPAYLELDARRDWHIRNVVSLANSACELGVMLTLRRCEHPNNPGLVRAAGIMHVQGSVLPGAEPEPEPAPMPQVVPMVQAPLV